MTRALRLTAPAPLARREPRRPRRALVVDVVELALDETLVERDLCPTPRPAAPRLPAARLAPRPLLVGGVAGEAADIGEEAALSLGSLVEAAEVVPADTWLACCRPSCDCAVSADDSRS